MKSMRGARGAYTDLQSRWTTQPSAGYLGRQRGDDAGVLRSTSRKATQTPASGYPEGIRLMANRY